MAGADQVVGGCMGVWCQLGKEQVSKALKFKRTRRELASLVDRIMEGAKEMKALGEELGGSTKVTAENLLKEAEQGKELVDKYSSVPFWKCCCLPCYQGKLQDKYNELARSLDNLGLNSAVNIQEILLRLRNTTQAIQINGLLSKPPPKPHHPIVGFEVYLNKLKNWLLDSTGGESVHVLSGLAGSGKTILATLLCCDQQVKDKFGENIIYLSLSKSSDMKSIVQSVIQNVRPDISDDQVVRLLKNLLIQKGDTSPVMLVLDNVWPGSKSLVEHFRVAMSSDYKILVTSRVDFPEFKSSCLKPLKDRDAITLFCHFAFPEDGTTSANTPTEELVEQVARGCWCSPLVLKLIGTSLRGQPIYEWEKMKNMLSNVHSLTSNDDLLNLLKNVFDGALEDKPHIKECFMDLGLFPENQEIPVASLIDMWTERKNLDKGSVDGRNSFLELKRRHLVNLVVKTTREETSHVDEYYNHHFLTQHDHLKELAIHQAGQEPFLQRNRLILDTNENNWPQQNQQNVVARTLSISTDKMSTLDWSSIVKAEKVEVLILNLRTNKYTLPQCIEKMTNLKVLLVTNYNGFQFAELDNFEILGSLPNLRRIRLQQVSVPPLCKMYSLQKLSLYNCETTQFFQSNDDTISISEALPNLEELSVDYCKDLVKLPASLCDIISFVKLSITRCIEFRELPQEIGNLKKLKVLRLSSCDVLGEIPASIGMLRELHLLDIWDCGSLKTLPEEIGELHNLKELHMTGGCLSPRSVTKLQKLRRLICDKETSVFWEENFKPSLPNLRIEDIIDDKLFINDW